MTPFTAFPNFENSTIKALRARLGQVLRLDPERSARSALRRVFTGQPREELRAEDLYQPQDGAASPADVASTVAPAKRAADLLMRRAAREPEDARLTGGTRSLMRRMSGLNFGIARGARQPVRSAAIVSTRAA